MIATKENHGSHRGKSALRIARAAPSSAAPGQWSAGRGRYDHHRHGSAARETSTVRLWTRVRNHRRVWLPLCCPERPGCCRETLTSHALRENPLQRQKYRNCAREPALSATRRTTLPRCRCVWDQRRRGREELWLRPAHLYILPSRAIRCSAPGETPAHT